MNVSARDRTFVTEVCAAWAAGDVVEAKRLALTRQHETSVMEFLFRRMLYCGFLRMAQWLAGVGVGGIPRGRILVVLKYADLSWRRENLPLLQWLDAYGLRAVPKRTVTVAALHGNLQTAKWLQKIAPRTFERAAASAIRVASLCGYTSLVEWMITIPNGRLVGPQAFDTACTTGGHLQIAHRLAAANCHTPITLSWVGRIHIGQWLLDRGLLDADKEQAFVTACRCGFIQMAKWLVVLGVDIHADGDKAFVGMFEPSDDGLLKARRHQLARWLISLDPDWDWPHDTLVNLQDWGACRNAWISAVIRASSGVSLRSGVPRRAFRKRSRKGC
jgi:hypothetical protein